MLDLLEIVNVWCSKCPEPATAELVVTDGIRTYRAACCARDLTGVARAAKMSSPYGQPLTEAQLFAAYGNSHTSIEMCQDCGHPVDGHDRRAEDGECEVCIRDGGSCRTHKPGCPLEAGGDCDCRGT